MTSAEDSSPDTDELKPADLAELEQLFERTSQEPDEAMLRRLDSAAEDALEADLSRLFQQTAMEPSNIDLTRLAARAADIPALAPKPFWKSLWLWVPSFAVAAAAVGLVLSSQGTVDVAPLEAGPSAQGPSAQGPVASLTSTAPLEPPVRPIPEELEAEAEFLAAMEFDELEDVEGESYVAAMGLWGDDTVDDDDVDDWLSALDEVLEEDT